MLRIGIAASKMSKGSLLKYNFYVVLIASLITLMMFLICGFSILLIVFLVSLLLHALKPEDFHASWWHMYKICLIILSIVMGILNLAAIIKNVQFTINKI